MQNADPAETTENTEKAQQSHVAVNTVQTENAQSQNVNQRSDEIKNISYVKNTKAEDRTSFPRYLKFLLIVLLLAVIISPGVVYYFFISPKLTGKNAIKDIRTEIDSLKLSVKNVVTVMDRIYYLSTEDTKSIDDNPAEISYLSPDNENRTYSPFSSLLVFVSKYQQSISDFSSNKDIAGIQSSTEKSYLNYFRSIKEETIKADGLITQAEKDLNSFVEKKNDLPKNIPSETKAAIENTNNIEKSASVYFAETRKVADYFSLISDIIIKMDTKIESFQNSLALAGSIYYAMVNQENSEYSDPESQLNQIQVFINQAQADTDELVKLTKSLENISSEDLPAASGEYHLHNIKTLSLVTDYFHSQSSTMQTLHNVSSFLINKETQNQLTQMDLRNSTNTIRKAILNAEESDAKFLSDLQSILSEEQSLVLSFWQNNRIVSTGSMIENELNKYNSRLAKTEDKNKIPLVN